jgi:hypothetical protein
VKREEAFKMKIQFEEVLNSIGYSFITEEYAYKLAAWLHHYGNHEAAVVNFSLSSDILIAQKLLGIKGGEPMKSEMVIKLKSYMDQGKDAPFMKEIFKKYGVKKPK